MLRNKDFYVDLKFIDLYYAELMAKDTNYEEDFLKRYRQAYLQYKLRIIPTYIADLRKKLETDKITLDHFTTDYVRYTDLQKQVEKELQQIEKK
jgi:hypothetical protein